MYEYIYFCLCLFSIVRICLPSFHSQFSSRVSRDNFYYYRKSFVWSGKFITETRFITRVRKTIDCKSFLFLCNVDAKIDGNCYEGPTLISSTRYSFPFEKVVSINMTRYSATFTNNEFSFSRFFFFSLSRVIYLMQLKCYILFMILL